MTRPGFQSARTKLAILGIGLVCGGLNPLFVSGQSSPASSPNARFARAGNVKTLVVQSDGKLIVGGYFYSVGGVPRTHLARINPNGSVDESWESDFRFSYLGNCVLQGAEL